MNGHVWLDDVGYGILTNIQRRNTDDKRIGEITLDSSFPCSSSSSLALSAVNTKEYVSSLFLFVPFSGSTFFFLLFFFVSVFLESSGTWLSPPCFRPLYCCLPLLLLLLLFLLPPPPSPLPTSSSSSPPPLLLLLPPLPRSILPTQYSVFLYY